MFYVRLPLIVGCIFYCSYTRADDASKLAKNLPETANTIKIVRMSSIFKTDRAKKEQWYEQEKKQFLTGKGTIPPWVDTLVIGSLLRPSSQGEVWEAAVLNIPKARTIEIIAKERGIQVERLSGLSAIRGQFDNYVMMPKPGLIATYRPAHRQEVSRWVRSIIKNKKTEFSPYLIKAAHTEGHIVLAIDLQDLVDTKDIEKSLQEDVRFASHQKLIQKLVKLIGGLRGVTLSVTIAEKSDATIVVDFSQNIGPTSPVVKTLLISVLDDLGATLDELPTSKVRSEDHSVFLTFQLSDESLERIFSLIFPPSTSEKALQPAKKIVNSKTTPTVNPVDPDRETKRYLEAVNNKLSSLKKSYKHAKTYDRTAFWHERFARRIIELPTTNVDPEVVKYGQSIASKLRALSASLRGEGVTVNTQQRTLTYNVHYNPGWARLNIWGGYGYRRPSYGYTSNLQQVREKQAGAVAKGANDRIKIWQLIDEERLSIAQKRKQK